MNYVGSLVTVIAAYALGRIAAEVENERLYAVNSLLGLLTYMQRRIASQRKTLYSIFSDYSDDYLEGVGFLEILRSGRADAPTMWSSALERIPVGSELRIELLQLGEGIGFLPLEQQLKRIDDCISALMLARSALSDELPKKKKSIKTVCMLLGLMISIILL